MLTSANVCKAAEQLRAENNDVNFVQLAAKLGTSASKVRYFVSVRSSLRIKLGLVDKINFLYPGLVMLCASLDIRKRGEGVSIVSLAEELGRPRSTVSMAISRHPQWRTKLGLMTQGEVRRRAREKKYEAAAQRLSSHGQVLFSHIARESGVQNCQIYKDFRRNPDLRTLLEQYTHPD